MTLTQQKQWKLRDPIPDEAHDALSLLPELQRTLLWHREVRTAEAADRFLNPSYERDLHDPFLIMNLEKAVDRILTAIKGEEQIVIYGDYDCDGIPGSTALYGFFDKINYPHIRVYIPHRYSEGYGLNIPAIEKLAAGGAKLLITVDSGITDVEQVARASELGIDVIITDHHLPQAELPKAFAVVNSKQVDDTYPFDLLCGAGVAFKLVQGLLRKWNATAQDGDGPDAPPTPDASVGASESGVGATHRKLPVGWEKWLLDVVGLATIADMVPLHGENRVLAYYGLKVLRQTPRMGLAHLLQKMGVKREHLNEDDVGFSIAPVVNAASRLGTPIDAFHMLASRNPVQAMGQAEALFALNTKRKALVKEMIVKAHEMVAEKLSSSVIPAQAGTQARITNLVPGLRRNDASNNGELPPVLVVGRPEWKPGLLGLAASALAEHYGRPTFVWGREGSPEVKGSCRSDGSVNMVDLMVAAGDVFLDKGGHELAGGFSCSDEHLDQLEPALVAAHVALAKEYTDTGCLYTLVDKKLEVDEITWKLYDQVAALAPFGMGNAKPLFLLENVPVSFSRMFGKEQNHLQLNLQKSDASIIPAIKFFAPTAWASTWLPGNQVEQRRVSMLAHLEKSTFGWKPELRLRIVDIV